MVRLVAELIAPVQRTIYGDTWDVLATPEPINVAYSTVELDFHMDLSYYESPPGIQLLHCVRYRPKGRNIIPPDRQFSCNFPVTR